MAVTANYGWTIPTVGGDTGAWGTVANNLYIAVDAALKVVSDVANAALSRAGGVMTGRLDAYTASQKRIDKGAVSGAVVFDLSLAQIYTMTVAGPLTVSFTNFPPGAVSSGVMFLMTNPGAFAITWPAASPVTKWSGGVVPTWTVAGVDRVAFFTDDAGATVHGVVVGKAIA